MAFVCPTILTGPGKGRTRNLESVTRRLVPISSAQCLTHTMLWGGAGWGWITCGGRSRPAGNPRLSLEQGMWVVLGQIRTDIFLIKSENPHVRMRSCQNASSSLHNRGAGLLEVWCKILGGGGEMISLADNEFNFFLLCSN